MFTGIIEQIGEVLKNENGKLTVAVTSSFEKGMKIGSSIAVNGACLTAVKFKTKVVIFDITTETLRCTNLGLLKKGDEVNLERAMKAGDRFEGHIVQGHIDANSKLKTQNSKLRDNGGKDTILSIEIPRGLEKYIVPKGSIAVDGISLTVVDVARDYFTVAIIPHTLENTIAKFYKEGSVVNIEVDILAKYVHKK
ncbi:MAG: riboflavin synthase [Candidatus Jacksonbacteria bacterium]|nr:riboflavin synthase [Candidatus Jacksonbacteria bacterium]